MLRGVGRVLVRVLLVSHGVVQVAADDDVDVPVEGGGEEQGLPLGRACVEQPTDLGQEAHVGHAVRLVQHDQLHVVEPHVALGDEVGEAAGARDGDVDAVRERAQLLAEPDAAVEGGDGLVGIGELAHLVADLRRQLTGGASTRGRGNARAGTPHALHEGDAEGEGLAGAGGRPAAHVAAGERRRDRPGLDGERLGDATPREAGGDVAVDAEGLEPACCGRGARGEVGRGGRRGRKGGGHRLLLEVFVAPSWGRARSGAR